MLGTIIVPFTEKVFGDHNYEVLTSSRNGIQRQSEHFAGKQRHDTDGYNIIPRGYCTYRNRSDDGLFTFNMNNIVDEGIVSKFYPVFTFQNANSTFMMEYLNGSPRVRAKLSVLAVGTSQVVLSFETLKETSFYLPTFEEQNRIAALLSTLNKRIEKQRLLIEHLKKYKRGAINAFFNPNNSSRTTCSLGEIGTIIRGLSYDKFDVVSDNSATVVLRSNNIQSGFLDYINDLQFVKKMPTSDQLLKKGDIVICMANGSASLVGKAACFDGDDKRIITVGAFCGIYRCEKEIIEYYFQSDKYTYALRKIQQGGDGAIGNLKPSNIESLEVSLPDEAQQQLAVKFFKTLDKKIYASEKILSMLMKIKAGLLHSLFV